MAIFKIKDATRIFFTIFPIFSALNYVGKYSQTFAPNFLHWTLPCRGDWSIYRSAVRLGTLRGSFEKSVQSERNGTTGAYRSYV